MIDGDLGGVAQIGVIDPNYSGPYSVSVTGGGLLLNSLQTLSNVINGTLSGTGGETTLSLNLANAVQLGLLGPNGDVVQICEQQNPTTCKSVSITNNGVVPQVGSSLDSIVFGPGGEQLLTLIAPTAQSLTGFTVTALPSGISVQNLGNGQFEFSAAANVAVPITGNVTLTNGSQTITIPIAVP